MSDFPKILTLNREARIRIAIGMKSDLFVRCRPLSSTHSFTQDEVVVVQESEESWSATRDRLSVQLGSDKPILILCKNDLWALQVAATSNPLGRNFRGWKKIERMMQDCGLSYAWDDWMVYSGYVPVPVTGRTPMGWLYGKGIQQFSHMWDVAKLRVAHDDMLDVCGISFKWLKPKFTLKDALTIKKYKIEERNEALKKFNPDPTKRRKR